MKCRLLCAALLLVTGASAHAQSNAGEVVGQVRDPQKALVRGAMLSISNTGTKQTENTKSNSDGTFSFAALPPGTYNLTVKKDGFDTEVINNIEVQTAQTTTQNITLRIGLNEVTVQVTGANPLVTSDSAMLSTTIESRLLVDLPTNDRSSLSAVLLVPGVQGDPQFPGGIQNENPGVYLTPVVPGASLAVAGGRPGSSSILVDSADNTLTSFPRTGITFSGITVQQITVQQNGLPAQYGRTGGGIINQTTRGGTSQFHGEASWIHGDPALDANTYGQPFGRERHVNYYTAAIGGPIMLPHFNGRNHGAYFYVTVEPTRGTDQNYGRGRFATPDELAGNFANSLDLLNTTILKNQGYAAAVAAPRSGHLYYQYAGATNTIPTGPLLSSSKLYQLIPGDSVATQLAMNPVARYVYGFFPTPQNPTKNVIFYNQQATYDPDGTNAYLVRGVEQFDNRVSARVDKSLSPRDFLMMRFTTVPVDGIRYSSFGPDSPVNTVPRDTIHSLNAIVGETHAFGASVNEFHVTYTRAYQLRRPPPAALTQDFGAMLGLFPSAGGVGFPSIGGFSNGNVGSGGNVLSNGLSLDVNLGLTDNYSFQRGLHTLKVGGDVRFLQQDRADTSGYYGGDYGFNVDETNSNEGSSGSGGSAEASFILGAVHSYTAKPAVIPFYYRWKYAAAYVQDDWRVLPKVTLNLGFRYNFETPRYEKYNRQGTFNPTYTGTLNGQPATGAFLYSGEDGQTRYLWPINFKGFEPRLGIAYAIKPSITFRGSYALTHPGLTGLGTIVEPDLSASAGTFNQKSFGPTGGHLNYLTNPVTGIQPHIPLSGGPLFTFTNQTALPYVDQSSTVPYVQLYSASLQFGISKASLVEISYSGQHAVHLISVPIDQNIPTLGNALQDISTGVNENATVANRYGLGSETQQESEFPYQQFYLNTIPSAYSRRNNSHYNGLFITYRHRFAKTLSVIASYTWAKSIDDGSNGSADLTNPTDAFGLPQTQNPYGDSRLERSVSTFDIPNKGAIGVTYTSPRVLAGYTGFKSVARVLANNWQATSTFTRQSGYPLGVSLGTQGYFFSTEPTTAAPGNLCQQPGTPNPGCTYASGGDVLIDAALRPNIVPGVPLKNANWKQDPFDRTGHGGYINPAAFAVPGALNAPAFGNAPRTLSELRNPTTQYMNLRVSRIINLSADSRFHINLLANVLNVLNHANFFTSGLTAYSSFTGTGGQTTFNQNASFGAESSTNITPGREVQLGIRVIF